MAGLVLNHIESIAICDTACAISAVARKATGTPEGNMRRGSSLALGSRAPSRFAPEVMPANIEAINEATDLRIDGEIKSDHIRCWESRSTPSVGVWRETE